MTKGNVKACSDLPENESGVSRGRKKQEPGKDHRRQEKERRAQGLEASGISPVLWKPGVAVAAACFLSF